MKNSVLFVLLISLTPIGIVQAQPYSHYLDYTTQWHESSGGCLTGCSSYNYHTYVDGDTLLNNKWYFKVSSCIKGRYTSPQIAVMQPDGSWEFHVDTTIVDTIRLLGYLREDAQKRFYYMPAGQTTEHLWFDFNLTIGSSFPGGYSCLIEGIDTIYFAGEPRKVFRTNGMSLIEGIGSYGGILNPEYVRCGYGIEFGGILVCFRNQCDSISFFPDNDCSFCKPQASTCLPESDFTFSADTICVNTCIQFFDKTNRQPTKWHWIFDGADISTYEGQHPPKVCYSDTGTFRVTLVAENRFGADSVAKDIPIKVKECRSCLHVPNVFTPNGDDVNDMFRAYSTCPNDYYNLQIFNRWGEKVFETDNINSEWNGRYRNKQLSPGCYPYYIVYQSSSKLAPEIESGCITLIR